MKQGHGLRFASHANDHVVLNLPGRPRNIAFEDLLRAEANAIDRRIGRAPRDPPIYRLPGQTPAAIHVKTLKQRAFGRVHGHVIPPRGPSTPLPSLEQRSAALPALPPVYRVSARSAVCRWGPPRSDDARNAV